MEAAVGKVREGGRRQEGFDCSSLVVQGVNSMTFAARGFRPRQGASDAHIPRGSVRSEQRRLGRKEPPPEGLRRIWPGASLLVGHSPTGGGCSLLEPRPRPNWAQQTSSNLRPGPLSFCSWIAPSAVRQACHPLRLTLANERCF